LKPAQTLRLARVKTQGQNEIMKVGYARVSSGDQTTALQIAALRKAGCKTVFRDEGVSGAISNRPALSRCLKKLEPGDVLVVWRLDRLGRSLGNLITTLDDLKRRGVKFQSITESIDTDTPTGRAMWQMIGIWPSWRDLSSPSGRALASKPRKPAA
jgi:DNA invertase Pin-like site-specific DNA recombinase